MMPTAPRPACGLTVLQRRRLSWRVAQGLSLGKAAQRAGLGDVASEPLLADTDFAALVEAYRSMLAMPEDARHRRLVELALLVLEEAVIRGDARAALFILAQRTRGRDPAAVLARGAVRALERQAPQPDLRVPGKRDSIYVSPGPVRRSGLELCVSKHGADIDACWRRSTLSD